MYLNFLLVFLSIGVVGAYYPGYQLFYQQDPRMGYYGYGQQGIPAAYLAAQQAQQAQQQQLWQQQLLAQRGFGSFSVDPGMMQQQLLRQQLMMQGYPGMQQFGYNYGSPFGSPYNQYAAAQQPFRVSGVKTLDPPQKD
ncbi:hypothetical protein FO519_007875 [Halicephalobus sp. NKZ332]|nr:hypothetical protein FO519_007875 [Halicephalobus sp. NKZ332]